MDFVTTTAADSTCDAESRSDLPRLLPSSAPAEIGDSITLTGAGDRIKVTVLGVIDPAVIKSRGIPGTLAALEALTGKGQPKPQNLRVVAVKLRMRNLEEAAQPGVLQGLTGGILFDTKGSEYSSTGDYLEYCPAVWPPNRGEQPKLMCDTFEIPPGEQPARYVLTLGRHKRSAGEWQLKRSQEQTVEPGQDFGIKEHLQLLEKGVDAWNVWREKHPKVEIQLPSVNLSHRDLKHINLSGANLHRTNFGGSNLEGAIFRKAHANSAFFPKANLSSADFSRCDLTDASLIEAQAQHAYFAGASLARANLERVQAYYARFPRADLREVIALEAVLMGDLTDSNLDDANLTGALLDGADMSRAQLRRTKLSGAYLRGTKLRSAVLREVSAYGANLQGADLTGATITDSDLSLVTLVHAKLGDAALINTRVFGISAWDVQGTPKQQDEIVITPADQARVTVSDLEVANFVYLILNNEKIRNAIETIGKKGVLILGRFTERKDVLEAIKKEISRLDLLPIVFDFDRPTNRDFTETVMTLAGMSRFIIADITAPKSVPLELEATVPNYMVPLVPLLAEGEKPFSMFQDLWTKYRDWVLEPLEYKSVDELIRVFRPAVVDLANERLELLRMRRAESMVVRRASDYDH